MKPFRHLLVAVLAALAASGCSHGDDPPPQLQKSVACMMQVLKARPDVDMPAVRAASRDGVKYLLIEYRAQERSSWTTPTSFSVSLDDNGKTRASALLPGVFSPLEGLDTHVTDEVMRAWRSECGVVSMAVLI